MKKANYIIGLFLGVWMMTLGGCSTQDDFDLIPNGEGIVSVNLEIGRDESYTRAPGDVALSVNRILILPFRKTDEALANVPTNFVPDYSAAKQLDVNSFPMIATRLNLSAASTYQLVIIGYNQNDYDFLNPSSSTRRFNIDSTTTPATLANLCLQPVDASVVPDLFSCIATGYMGTSLVGQTFKPSQVDNIRGTLSRLVSALTLHVTDVPAYVKSMTLVAERLVTAINSFDATPLAWQTAGDDGAKTLGNITPVVETATFNLFMMPGTDSQGTLLYLDVAYGTGFTERYTVKVEDVMGVVNNKRITFSSNHWVKIAGSYSDINLGFTLSNSVNLDDDSWDGIQ